MGKIHEVSGALWQKRDDASPYSTPDGIPEWETPRPDANPEREVLIPQGPKKLWLVVLWGLVMIGLIAIILQLFPSYYKSLTLTLGECIIWSVHL